MLNKRVQELWLRMLTLLPVSDRGPQLGPALTARHGTGARRERGATVELCSLVLGEQRACVP